MQGQEDISAGDEWAAVDGDRDEDLGQGGGQLPGGGAREAVVDDSVVLAGVRGFLSDVHGQRAKYSERIHALPGPKEPIYKTFSLKGYLIIAFMITLGITLKYVPGIPRNFFAWFYLGLGAGLLSAGIRFLSRWWKGRGIKE